MITPGMTVREAMQDESIRDIAWRGKAQFSQVSARMRETLANMDFLTYMTFFKLVLDGLMLGSPVCGYAGLGMDFLLSNILDEIKAESEEPEEFTLPRSWATMPVGDNEDGTQQYVHGPYEAVRQLQEKLQEKLQAVKKAL